MTLSYRYEGGKWRGLPSWTFRGGIIPFIGIKSVDVLINQIAII
jgi:hypothetical protein